MEGETLCMHVCGFDYCYVCVSAGFRHNCEVRKFDKGCVSEVHKFDKGNVLCVHVRTHTH